MLNINQNRGINTYLFFVHIKHTKLELKPACCMTREMLLELYPFYFDIDLCSTISRAKGTKSLT